MSIINIKPGEIRTWLNGTGSTVTANSLVDLGDRFGVALVDIANAAYGEVATCGEVELDKATGALVAGQRLYWAPADSDVVGAPAITATAAATTKFIGYAPRAYTSGAAKAGVLLAPFAESGLTRFAITAAAGIGAAAFTGDVAVITNTTAGATALAIPAAASVVGKFLHIKNIAGTNALTITPAAGTINGGANYNSIDAVGDRATFFATGTNWELITATIA